MEFIRKRTIIDDIKRNTDSVTIPRIKYVPWSYHGCKTVLEGSYVHSLYPSGFTAQTQITLSHHDRPQRWIDRIPKQSHPEMVTIMKILFSTILVYFISVIFT